jgi:DNA invertase Pin-like site-specific DNA recombinase
MLPKLCALVHFADGCERINEDTMSGTTTSRPALDEALETLQGR